MDFLFRSLVVGSKHMRELEPQKSAKCVSHRTHVLFIAPFPMHNLDTRARISPIDHLQPLTVDRVDLTQGVFHLSRERQILELIYIYIYIYICAFWLHVKMHDNKKM